MSIDIVAENALAGSLNFGDMIPGGGHGDLAVAGFARQISYNVGETVQFCVTGASTQIRIYRAGWYGGMGFRLIETISNTPATQGDGAAISGSFGGTTMTGWTTTATWVIPSTAVSGIYMAMIRNAADTNAFYAVFVVRDDAAVADIVYKTSDTTWNGAYNNFGTLTAPQGSNLYGTGTGVGSIMERSTCVSYHRPVITRGSVIQTYWWACELPLIRFLERNGYSVKYISSVDLDKNGATMLSGKAGIFVSSGHDEYWTTNMRNAVEEFRDVSGGHSVFMSGNEVFWRARFEYVGDEARMWCYKDTMPGPTGVTRNPGDPLDPVTWTGTWRDTRWPDRRPEWFLTGTQFGMNGVYDYDVIIPKNPYGGLPVWGGSSLVDNDVTMVKVLGFEADHASPTQPAGSYSYLATYTHAAPGGLSDANGQNYNVVGDVIWGIVAQRFASGALIVGFGTCQWSWALDGTHDRASGTPVSLPAQTFTINLLNDMGAQPQTLMSGVSLRAQNPLDTYGIIPGSTPPPVQSTNVFYGQDGTIYEPYILVGTDLVRLEVHL